MNEQRSTLNEPLVRGGQGRTAQDVEDTAVNGGILAGICLFVMAAIWFVSWFGVF